jgi:hypothetical protein
MKDIKDVSAPLIVAWFRSQAKRFTEMADFVESTFASKMPNLANGARMKVADLNAENIHDAVAKRGQRISDLAKRFNSLPSEVEDVVNASDSGLYIAHAGWVKPR